jgi:hypothetical protein
MAGKYYKAVIVFFFCWRMRLRDDYSVLAMFSFAASIYSDRPVANTFTDFSTIARTFSPPCHEITIIAMFATLSLPLLLTRSPQHRTVRPVLLQDL